MRQIVFVGVVGAAVVAFSCTSGSATSGGNDAGNDAGQQQSQCNLGVHCSCADGTSSGYGCGSTISSCAEACKANGGECPATGPGCACADGTSEYQGVCNNASTCENACQGHCGWRGDGGLVDCDAGLGGDGGGDSGDAGHD